MRLSKAVRPLMPILLIGAMLLLASNEAQSQGRKNNLPARPRIFLNNNASLYTYANPNFGLPSQGAHSFVAVAHEDCRLFNNGATIMPQFRLLAAECQQLANNLNNNNSGAGVLPGGFVPLGICPTDGLPIFDEFTHPPFPHSHPSTCLAFSPPFVPGIGGIPSFGGVNYNRYRPYPAAPSAASYPGASNGSNYDSYNPNVAANSTMLASSEYHPTAAAGAWGSRGYRGFGRYSESSFGGFSDSVGIEPSSQFGGGFIGKQCKNCTDCEEKTAAKPSSANSDVAAEK